MGATFLVFSEQNRAPPVQAERGQQQTRGTVTREFLTPCALEKKRMGNTGRGLKTPLRAF